MDVGTGKDLQEYGVKMTNDQCPMTNKIPNPKAHRACRQAGIPNKIQNLKSKTRTSPARFRERQRAGRAIFEARPTTYNLQPTIPYHLIDIIKPSTNFNLAKYQKLAFRAINDILKRGQLPIIVGGTGLYIQSIVDNYDLPKGRPDFILRKKLQKKSLADLLHELKKKDLYSYNKVDKKNKRRVGRALEYFLTTGNSFFKAQKKKKSDLEFLIIGIQVDRKTLHKRIYQRLIHRLEKEEMLNEVKRLHREGVSWKRLESFGLEYKWISQYLRHQIDYDKMVEALFKDICHFAKRQMTWFRRDRRVLWFKEYLGTLGQIRTFLRG
jgi:tRNA dimethylallyltransferase